MFQRKLQEQGRINSIDQQVYEFDNPESSERTQPDGQHRLNELEALLLMPVLIDELQNERISTSEQSMLRTMYGPLWQLMVDEVAVRNADKSNGDDSDPVLVSLLSALRRLEDDNGEFRGASHAEGAIEDVRFRNLWNGSSANVAEDEPAQRLLKLVAILIHFNA